jgi:hypothetical protein
VFDRYDDIVGETDRLAAAETLDRLASTPAVGPVRQKRAANA